MPSARVVVHPAAPNKKGGRVTSTTPLKAIQQPTAPRYLHVEQALHGGPRMRICWEVITTHSRCFIASARTGPHTGVHPAATHHVQ